MAPDLHHKLIRNVKQTIIRYRMLQPGDRALIGVSGGPDSVALFHILKSLASDLSADLAIAHVNHLLRGDESERDALFTERLAKQYNIPYYTECADVRKHGRDRKLSVEEAARNLRYAFLFQTMTTIGFNKIALGHQADDNAELFLMNLFRGSGSKGLSGIPPIRDGAVIRPLIRISRSEILDFLSENRIDYVSDSSNDDPKFVRNRIRRHLIPEIQANYNRNIVRTLNRTSSVLEDEEDWIGQIIADMYRSVVLSENETGASLSVSALSGKHAAALRRLIRKSVQNIKGDLKKISFQQIDRAVQLLQSRKKNWQIDLPDRIRIMSDAETLTIKKEQNPLRTAEPTGIRAFEYMINEPGNVCVKEAGMRLEVTAVKKTPVTDILSNSRRSAYFDGDIVRFPLTVRNVRPGDRFRPSGMKGTQKVSDFFINNKISKSERAGCPLLVSRDQIIWIVGCRTGEFGKMTPDTRKILKAEVFLA